MREQATIWGPGMEGIAIEMCGGSKMVVQWLRGVWACDNSGYAKRIARIQNIMYCMCEQHNTRCPTHGKEFWKHIYREANAYAVVWLVRVLQEAAGLKWLQRTARGHSCAQKPT
eukprot:8544782-Pyramimonas_sp.AAC.1